MCSASFPEALNISSSGRAATNQSSRLGSFLRMAGVTRNTRPVWQKGAAYQFLFLEDSYFWIVGSNYSGNLGGLASTRSNLPRPPLSGWEFYNSTADEWQKDP